MGDRLDALIEQLRTETYEARRDRIIDEICNLRTDLDTGSSSNGNQRSSANHSWSPSSLDGTSHSGHSFCWNLFMGIILFPFVLVYSILKLLLTIMYSIIMIPISIIMIPISIIKFIIEFIVTNIILSLIRMVLIAFLLHCLLLWYFNRGYSMIDILKLLNLANSSGEQFDNHQHLRY